MKTSELREHQALFNYEEYVNSKESKELLKLRKRFVKDYPIEKIRSLSLDEYSVGKGLKSSFCYRIETELNLWGNIHGSTARKFGVYYGILGDDKNKKYRIGKSYFGSNIEEAFTNVKEKIIELIENRRDLEILKKNKLSPIFKGKILSIYYPEEFLNTFSSAYLNHFINNLSIVNYSKSELDKQQALLDFKNNDKIMKDWNILTFNQFLYDSFGTPKNNSNKDLKDYTTGTLPPIESIKIEEVDLSLKDLSSESNKRNGKVTKTDFIEKSKRNKIVGDRGELIAFIEQCEYLKDRGREDLAKKVDHVSIYNDNAGYDIKSYDLTGNEIYIEVKSTSNPTDFKYFFISKNELLTVQEKENYYIHFVHDACSKSPKIWKVKGVDFLNDEKIEKEAISFKIRFNTKQ